MHIKYTLREPVDTTDPEMLARVRSVYKRLAAGLGADPAPAHPAALLRMPGTHNTKYGEPVLVEAVGGSGRPVDLSELEDLCDLLEDKPLFTRKQVNGHTNGSTGPVDIDARLDGIADGHVHHDQLSISAAMLRRGLAVSEVVLEPGSVHTRQGWRRRLGLGSGGTKGRAPLLRLHKQKP